MKKNTIIGIILPSLFFIGCSNKASNKKDSRIDSNTTIVKTNNKTISNMSKKHDSNEWNLAKVQGKKLIFDNGKAFETSLFNLKYIGYLKTKNKMPYFILSGRSCKNCDENISIYIWSPSDGEMRLGSQQPRYSYPGKEEDYLTHKLVYENRFFFGNCSEEESCIWVQRILNKNKLWINSVFIVKIKNDMLQEIRLSESPELNELLSKVTKCSELLGSVNTSEP